VNLLARRGDGLHVDTLDLYAARPRTTFIVEAARELGVREEQVKKDLGTLLLEVERAQAERLARAERPLPRAVELTPSEQAEALDLLRSPDLMDRILADFTACGVVGEEVNKLVGYLATVSRKLERPLGLIVQSASAAGKTSLMDAVLAFVPDEDRVQYSALTGQSLFYMEGLDLRHKVLAVVASFSPWMRSESRRDGSTARSAIVVPLRGWWRARKASVCSGYTAMRSGSSVRWQ
jgi:hypothetical protein